MQRKRITVTLICAQCGLTEDRAVWNPTQTPKYCSFGCRLVARGHVSNQGLSVPEQRERNRRFVREIRNRTVCERCRTQPIQWHNAEHAEVPGRAAYRISRMVQQPCSIAAITTEIARCQALCARCHQIEDGRLARFMTMASAPKPKKEPTPCIECNRLYKPLRRGLCVRCDSRQRYYRKTETGENAGAASRRELRWRSAS